jgi:hypothetical protein
MDALRANRPVVTEVRTIAKGGAVRWVRVYGHPVWDPARNMLVGIYGAVQDVTERRQAEADREALIRELEAKNAELERFPTPCRTTSRALIDRGFLGLVEKDTRRQPQRLKADVLGSPACGPDTSS